VAGALLVAGGMTAISMPESAEHFHGDGTLGQQISIVSAHGGLDSDPDALGPEQLRQLGLSITATDLELFARAGDALPVLNALNYPTDCLMGLGRVGGPDGGGSLGHSDVHGLAAISNSKASPNPRLAQGAAVASERIGQVNAALASLISPVKIQQLIRGEQFAGHVFNLQSEGGWYVAGSIVTHNCRCDVIPIIPDNEEA
jgi:hypothetical protein